VVKQPPPEIEKKGKAYCQAYYQAPQAYCLLSLHTTAVSSIETRSACLHIGEVPQGARKEREE